MKKSYGTLRLKKYMSKNQPFLKFWAGDKDPDRKTFEKFDFLPPPYVKPHADTYNLFNWLFI